MLGSIFAFHHSSCGILDQTKVSMMPSFPIQCSEHGEKTRSRCLPSLALSKTTTVTLVEGFFGFATEKILLAALNKGKTGGRSLRETLFGTPGSKTSIGTLMQCVSKHSSGFSLEELRANQQHRFLQFKITSGSATMRL